MCGQDMQVSIKLGEDARWDIGVRVGRVSAAVDLVCLGAKCRSGPRRRLSDGFEGAGTVSDGSRAARDRVCSSEDDHGSL